MLQFIFLHQCFASQFEEHVLKGRIVAVRRDDLFQTLGGIQGNDHAAVDDGDAVAQDIRLQHVVGGEQDGGAGFLVETDQRVTGNDFTMTLTAGRLIAYGAGNTRLRITVTGPNQASVDLDDGSGIFVPQSPIVF